MMPDAPRQENGAPAPPNMRRFMSRGEAAILLGMALTVFSLFFYWSRLSLPANVVPGAMFMNLQTKRTGFASPVRWPLTLCATLCGAVLLWVPTERTRLPLAVVQAASGLACGILIVTHFEMLPGVFIALAGAALMVFGAMDRLNDANGGAGKGRA